jgi:hypothetical protein
MSDHDSKSGRTVLGIGAGALLALLLLGAGGWRLGRKTGADGKEDSGTTPRQPGRPCRVRLDEDGIELDGVPADLPTVVSRCQAAGSADVTATGAAIVGAITEVLTALRDAGVIVRASPELWDVARLPPPARQPK